MVQPGKLVAALPDPTGRPLARDAGVLRLGHNERTTQFPEDFFAAMLRTITPADVLAIPDLTVLYGKLSRHLSVTPDQVLLSPGADAALDWIFHAYLEAGDAVLHVTPTYHRYPQLCRLYGARSTTLCCDDELGYDVDDVIRAVGVGTKLVILVNPHSPSGQLLPLPAIDTVVSRAADVGALVVVDEVYHPFGEVTCLPAATRLPNLVVVRSFSKAFGAAGPPGGVRGRER